MQTFEITRDGFKISTDREQLDLVVIHNFLEKAYWSEDIPFEIVKQSVENSLCFGLYQASRQIGFARVVSDYTTFAYLADVFVLEPYRGRGLSKWLMAAVMGHPSLQGLRKWMLATRDAHGLYRQYGFELLHQPEWYMEVRNPDIYKRN